MLESFCFFLTKLLDIRPYATTLSADNVNWIYIDATEALLILKKVIRNLAKYKAWVTDMAEVKF